MTTQDLTPQRDTAKGQITVEMPDSGGRVFAVIPGRRWTRIAEYLSNGQLTARFFVDEANTEVRLADSWKSPKTWQVGQCPAFFYALEIVAKARA